MHWLVQQEYLSLSLIHILRIGRVLRIKKFCGIRCRFDFFGCEMPTVLSSPFFFIINCLFTCFDIISALSVKSGCHIMSARGTRNFGIILISSGNRHIFTSMFKCAANALKLFYQEILSPFRKHLCNQ